MVLMLDEVPRHVLEPPSDVFTERLLEFAASRAAPLLFRYLAQVNLAFDPVRSDCFAARFVALASWPSLFRFFDLLFQLRVFPSLGLWVELRLQLFTTALAHQLLEHQLELSGVGSVRPAGLGAGCGVAQIERAGADGASEQDCQTCPAKDQCCPRTRHGRSIERRELLPDIAAFRQKMQTDETKAIYKTRSQVAEFPNLWIKAKFGLRQFSVRRIAKVRTESQWVALTYDILQWIRLRWRPKMVSALAPT